MKYVTIPHTGTVKTILCSQKLNAPNSMCEQFSLVYYKEKFVISNFIYVTTWKFKIFVCCSVPCFAVSAVKPSKREHCFLNDILRTCPRLSSTRRLAPSADIHGALFSGYVFEGQGFFSYV